MGLGAFSNLRTLSLKSVSIGKGCFCSALGAMPLLADLSILYVSFLSDTPLPTSQCSMTQLTSFEFRSVFEGLRFGFRLACRGLRFSEDNYSVWRWIETAASGFTHLTRLSCEFPNPAYGLPSSKTMTHLGVHMQRPMAPEQLIQIPEIMPHLESLEIYNHDEQQACYIPSCMFLRMEGLRSLTLTFVDVELDFFDVLASLEHLTALRFFQDRGAAHSIGFYAEVNRLTNLLFLRLRIQSPDHGIVLENLSGEQLSRLQVLELPGYMLTYHQKNSLLFSRFPSLRRFLP